MQESSPCTPRSGGRRTVLLSGLFVFLVGVCVWLLAMAIWEANTWSDLKMEEIVNQLATPMEGTGGFMIEGYLLVCVLPALLAMIAAGVFLFRFRGRPQYPTVIRRGSLIGTLFTAAMLAYAFFLLDVGNYLIEANTDSDYIEKNYVDPRQVELTLKEFELLVYLMENQTRVVTRDELLNQIWGYEYDGETRTLDMHIRTLRQKLGEEGGACIRTVRGVGYRMVRPEA